MQFDHVAFVGQVIPPDHLPNDGLRQIWLFFRDLRMNSYETEDLINLSSNGGSVNIPLLRKQVCE